MPLDESGVCLFHSQNTTWKRQENFAEKFLQILKALTEDESIQHYDFAEFVFVGTRSEKGKKSEAPLLRLADTTLRKPAYFIGAQFSDKTVLERVDFRGGATFAGATFANGLRVEDSSFRGLDFGKVELTGQLLFSNVDFRSYALFEGCQFGGAGVGFLVKFESSRFYGITDFSGTTFSEGDFAVCFRKVRFEDFTDFKGTRFHCHLKFDEVLFASLTEFIDTSFDTVGNTARYRDAAVEFNRIEITEDGVLTFKSTDQRKKMFAHNVQFSFEGDPQGLVRFENVNFHKLSKPSRERLKTLAKSGRVEIGPGCIKYRHQTSVRKVQIDESNVQLVLEICQTFTHYFTANNGLNLGFEIVARDESEVSFFYFTDEDISKEIFQSRLQETEHSLWNLLSNRPHRQLLALEEPAADQQLEAPRRSTLVNAVDGISAMLGTFFRAGTRIALGAWRPEDTRALLSAINFSEAGVDSRASNLHAVLVDRYTGQTLMGINRSQNVLLAPMVAPPRKALPAPRIRILFLGTNSLSSPLELGKEVSEIQTNLRIAKERDNLEFKQEWAVRIDTLVQAILDNRPTIVHFSGHGGEDGIVLNDEQFQPTVVAVSALSNFFKLFKDTVSCVVLNSCYSEPQARAIRAHIPHVIGMSHWLPDSAAIAFSTGFYKAIGAGKDVPFAFELGKSSIELKGLEGADIPILL